ncbi:Protein stu1 [Penicillium macrosclerotiorum]|uniref:Protein stu1 n=1 Tax=Penicillium macrosclerotiorum TaxID=303699 RepID=UPI0025483DD4|nr:Protein stu1 [Penicillium macrosclerotiorum]KAJ5682431.1 Protein stu1 [Penicillium macrosclerotiorum]
MEAKAAELLAAFKNPNLSVDAKVAHLTAIKSDIKQKNVPEGAILTIFETLKLSLSSQHSSVLSAGFSTLGHFLKRLSIQDQQQWIVNQARDLYPILLDRLGDHKERVRAQSATIFTELWSLSSNSVSSNEVEYYVLETALVGKNPRAKEMSMLWLSNMTRNHGLLFRQYVPSLVACLEDADSAVRDTARSVVVELFQNASARAKSDLQKQLAARGVRKSIANTILSGIGLGSAESESSTRPMSRAERPMSVMSSRSRAMEIPDDEPETSKSRPGSPRSRHDRSTPSAPSEPLRPKTPSLAPTPHQPSLVEDDSLEPSLVSSGRDIDDAVRDMLPWFEGRESEDNWSKREKNVILFRRITRGNAPHDFPQNFVNAVKSFLDGIFKVVNSLRTTLCTNGCLLMQDIAKTCGPKIDSMVEIIMQNLIKLCASLKKIAAQNGNATVDAVIGNVSFNIRILQHVHWACQEKNVQLRLFGAGWLKTLISRQAHQKSTVEHGNGLDFIEKSLKKGLGDANPGVREAVRSTFWTFYGVWPDRAYVILSDLDPKSRSLLEKDPSNPNAAQKTSTISGKIASGQPSGRSALKEAIAARKKAQMPSRPESAHSAFVDSDPATRSSTRSVPTGAPLSSLHSAPMRPSMKPRRPEISRPATADPYARRPDRPDSRAQSTSKPVSSPRSVRSKASTPSSKPINAPRLRPHESGQTGTTRGKPKKLDLSKSKSHGDLAAASRARSDSDDSIVNQPSVHTSYTGLSTGSNIQNQRAHIVLESPILSASQPPPTSSQRSNHSDHSHGVVLDPVENPEPLSLDGASSLATSPQEAELEVATPLRRSDTISEPEQAPQSQSDEMVIYEDPATPAVAEAKTPELSPVQHFTPRRSPRRNTEQDFQETVHDVPTLRETPVKKPAPELAPVQDFPTDGVNEPRFPSPKRTPLRGTPSPTRNRGPATPLQNISALESSLPTENMGTDTFEHNPNNENAATHIAKVPELAPTPRSAAKSGALEEVSLNESTSRPVDMRGCSFESVGPSTTEELSLRRSRKWAERHRSPSPRSKDPVNAREMLNKALSRIATKNMDISGYRKLQGLYQYHGEDIVSHEQDYYSLLQALLSELESAPTSRKDHDIKTQILATIRSMLLRTSVLFHRYDVPAMAAIIRARGHYESSSHFVTCLEEVVEQLVSLISPETVVNGVLQGLDLDKDTKSENASRSIIMGLATIHQALSQGPVEISDDVLASIGAVVSQQLAHPRPGVRKQATELCTLLNLKFGLDRVQKVTQPAGEGSLNLLTYFMARRSQ